MARSFIELKLLNKFDQCCVLGMCAGGHYKANVRQKDGQWLRFDDEMVTAVTQENVFNQEAYVLVYQRGA